MLLQNPKIAEHLKDDLKDCNSWVWSRAKTCQSYAILWIKHAEGKVSNTSMKIRF